MSVNSVNSTAANYATDLNAQSQEPQQSNQLEQLQTNQSSEQTQPVAADSSSLQASYLSQTLNSILDTSNNPINHAPTYDAIRNVK